MIEGGKVHFGPPVYEILLGNVIYELSKLVPATGSSGEVVTGVLDILLSFAPY